MHTHKHPIQQANWSSYTCATGRPSLSHSNTVFTAHPRAPLTDSLSPSTANFHIPAKDDVFEDVLFTEIYGQAANKIVQQYKDDALGLPSYPQSKRGRYDRYDRPPGPPGRFGPPRSGGYYGG